ncbi:MAG: integrase core domain-containing protein [Acetobacteraceae bacterium]
MTPSYAFVGEPETNGVAERFFRTLKEQIVQGRIFQHNAALRAAGRDFITQYNASWLLEKNGFLNPSLREPPGTRPISGWPLSRLLCPRNRVRYRIPDLREGDDSPLSNCLRPATLGTCPSRWLPIPRICRCVRNATCHTQSPRCVSASHAH